MHGTPATAGPTPLRKTSNKAEEQKPGGLGCWQHGHLVTVPPGFSVHVSSQCAALSPRGSRVQASAPALALGPLGRVTHAPANTSVPATTHLTGQLRGDPTRDSGTDTIKCFFSGGGKLEL